MTEQEYEVQVALGLLPPSRDLEVIVVYQVTVSLSHRDAPDPHSTLYKLYGTGWQATFNRYPSEFITKVYHISRTLTVDDAGITDLTNHATRKQLLNKVIEQL